jgi:CDP-diacylglycerol--glycerol-3-phosphate 3-phosphatidyltransferase
MTDWKKRLPMQLTWARIAIAPPIVALVYYQDVAYRGAEDGAWCGYVSAALFVLASVTDWFDGALARKYGAVSNMGKFMDPIADKILVSSVLIMLIPSGRIGPLVVLLLLVRDILVGGIRSVAAADNLVIDAKSTGKWKTGVQMAAIPMLLFHTPLLGLPLYEIGYGLLWVSAILSVLSGMQYANLYARSRKSAS